MDAAIEIGLAVVATTLTLCRGVRADRVHERHPGRVLRAVRLHRVVAVLFSLLVARTLTPMMAAYLLKPHDDAR